MGAPAPNLSPSTYSVRLFNCDDSCQLLVDGRPILASGFGQDTGLVDITAQLKGGRNDLVFQVLNQVGAITYGFQVTGNGALIFQQVCGQAYVQGCENNRAMPAGVARQFSFTISQ